MINGIFNALNWIALFVTGFFLLFTLFSSTEGQDAAGQSSKWFFVFIFGTLLAILLVTKVYPGTWSKIVIGLVVILPAIIFFDDGVSAMQRVFKRTTRQAGTPFSNDFQFPENEAIAFELSQEKKNKLKETLIHVNLASQQDMDKFFEVCLYTENVELATNNMKQLYTAGCRPSENIILNPSLSRETMKIVLEHGGNPNYLDTNYKTTPLHYWATYGKGDAGKENIKLLLQFGADPNYMNENKLPILTALDSYNWEMAATLIESSTVMPNDTAITKRIKAYEADFSEFNKGDPAFHAFKSAFLKKVSK
jgi:hypothetical protein